jgi:pimeloyl-ACP methyl ester carboxylesterase
VRDASERSNPEPEPRRIDVETARGVHIAVHDWGGPEPPAVLLHPNGFNAGIYEPIARGIRSRARPVAVDLRGHGASSAPPDPAAYAFMRLAEDVAAVLDQLGIERAAGVGGSLGGAVAVLVDRLRPGSWTRLLLAEPVAFPPVERASDGENPMAAAARRRRARFPSREAIVSAYRRRPPMSELAPEALEAYVRWGTVPDGRGVRLACSPEVEATIFEVSARPDGAAAAWEHLAHLSCPTTIVAGQDSFLPDVFAGQAERAGAELVTVSGGHFVLHEDTARGIDLVVRNALG